MCQVPVALCLKSANFSTNFMYKFIWLACEGGFRYLISNTFYQRHTICQKFKSDLLFSCQYSFAQSLKCVCAEIDVIVCYFLPNIWFYIGIKFRSINIWFIQSNYFESIHLEWFKCRIILTVPLWKQWPQSETLLLIRMQPFAKPSLQHDATDAHCQPDEF